MNFGVAPTAFDSPPVRRLLRGWNEELAREVPDFDPNGGSVPEPEEFLPPNGAFLLLCDGGAAIGCGGLRRLAVDVAEIKRLYVLPEHRGRGGGACMLVELELAAVQLGYSRVRLDTASGESAAARLFQRARYRSIAAYNDNPYAQLWFEKDLLWKD